MQVQDDKPYDDINITPMLDLAYVLLVIFILMCTATVQGLKANLPQGSKGTKSLAKKKGPGDHHQHRGQSLSRYVSGHAHRTRGAARANQGGEPERSGRREG